MTQTRRSLLALILLAATALPLPARAADVHPPMTVWKSATCGCCIKWVDHLRAAGFKVVAKNVDDLNAVKTARAIPERLQSCHTAEIGGYLVEGHVPAADIARLLTEKPDIAGLAVPGMPLGSPGMEVPSGEKEPYEVVAFDKAGKPSTFARH